jgi:hypothetical protein
VKQIPSAELFVVRPREDREEVERRLAPFGDVEEIKGSNELLLHHAAQSSSSDSKIAWQEARARLGMEGTIHPVLFDERGNPHYPTGEITVRFNNSLSDEQLEQFAETHHLRLRDRNEYVPEQAVFYPLEPEESYIPELLKEIAEEKNAKAVWANTLSRYERLANKAKID